MRASMYVTCDKKNVANRALIPTHVVIYHHFTNQSDSSHGLFRKLGSPDWAFLWLLLLLLCVVRARDGWITGE